MSTGVESQAAAQQPGERAVEQAAQHPHGHPAGHAGHPHGSHAVGAMISARRQAVREILSAGRSDRRQATADQLIASGRALFTDKGIGATSVGDICKRAGFTRGAFYSNFTDMDHFVRVLAEQQWEQMAQFVRSVVDEVLPTAAQSAPARQEEMEKALETLTEQILRAMPVSREFYLLQNELVAYIVREGERSAPLRAAYAAFKESLRQVLVLGMEAIGRECRLSPDDTTELLFAAAERSMRVALMEGRELTEQLDRTLPVLLTYLSRPVVPAGPAASGAPALPGASTLPGESGGPTGRDASAVPDD